jgi:tRNA(Met) C34 N-acetyltransferase TmcA
LNIDDGKKKIKLYKAQKRVLRQMMDNRFFILLASRQIGKSTLMTIYILWMANFHSDQRILLVANKESTAIEIFSRVRMAYEMLPNWLKSPVVEFAKTSMELENSSRVSITTTTGTAARGQAVSTLILDEAAFVECVSGETSITLRNKTTGEIQTIAVADFKNKLSKTAK